MRWHILKFALPITLFSLLPSQGTTAKGDVLHTHHPTGVYLNSLNVSPRHRLTSVRMDENNLPEVMIQGEYRYNPVTISQYGLQQFSYHIAEPDPEHINNMLNAADWLLTNQDFESGKWYYNFDYNVGGMGVRLDNPWASAMAQGQAISLLARAHHVTGDAQYLDAAERGLLPLSVPIEEGGLLADFFGHPYYEEYPTTPPSFTLNGFMFTLVGLYDLHYVAGGTKVSPLERALTGCSTSSSQTLVKFIEEEAGHLFEQGMQTLIHALPFHDTGTTSFYHLGHITNPPRPVTINPNYHPVHIYQLKALQEMWPHPVLDFYHERWVSYLTE